MKEQIYTEEEFAKALELSAKECNLDAHISYIGRKSDLQTWADKIISRFFRKGMPVKRSYMMCNALDMTFYYLPNGEAVYTYAGYADNRDADEEHIVNAFRKANEMRTVMDGMIKKVHEAEQKHSESNNTTVTAVKPIHVRYRVKNTNRLHHSIYCGVCGVYATRVSKGDEYCRKCGTRIDWSKNKEEELCQ